MSKVIELSRIGVAGLNTSKAREQLSPQEAWIMSAVRSFKGKIETSPGRKLYSDDTLSGTPTGMFTWKLDSGADRFNIGTTTKLYRMPTSDSESLVDITRAAGGDYTGAVTDFWDFCSFGNTVIMTNGVDAPQAWNGTDANAAALAGSPPIGRTVMSFLTYVVFGNIGLTRRLVQWGDTGSSTTWTGGDSGSLTVYQGPGEVLRCLQLGDVGVIYRPDSIHILFFVGSPFILAQRQVVSSVGLIARRAVGDIGGRHIYWGTDNIYIFDGVNNIPVGDKVIADMQLAYIPAYQDRIAVGVDLRDHEAYFMYPDEASVGGELTQAHVYNWAEGTWRKEPLSQSITAAVMFKRRVGLTWEEAIGTWEVQAGSWQAQTLGAGRPMLVVAAESGKVYLVDPNVVNIDGAARERIFESGLLDIGALLFERPGSRVTLEKIEVEFEHKGTLTVEVWVGTQTHLAGDGSLSFTKYSVTTNEATHKKTLYTRKTSQYFTFRIRTAGVDEAFRVSALRCFFSLRGNR